jgi:putrescine transport system permease protein
MGVSPQINALATLIILLVSIAVIITGLLMMREQKQLAQKTD